jgi:hypothetical protein
VSVIAVGVAGYAAVRALVYEQLSPWLASELSKTLQRQVKVGKVESVALNHIRLGASSIAPTPSDPDRLTIQAIAVNFNPLPLLWGQPLALDVTVVAPKLYLEQDKTGQWIRLQLPEGKAGKPPIALDATFHLQQAKIDLQPQQTTRSIGIAIAGRGQYRSTHEQQVGYDLEATLLNSRVKVKGESVIETGKSQLDLVVDKLAIAELVSLIPNAPVKAAGGQVNADLALTLPSLNNLPGTRGRGTLSLSELQGTVKTLKQPLQASLQLNLQGQKVIVEKAQVSLGKLVTQAQGTIDWVNGYALDIALKPVSLPALFKTFSLTPPLSVTGEMQGRLQLRGDLTRPRVTGSLSNRTPVQIDRVPLKALKTDLQADLNKVLLTQVQILPAAGGQIVGSGKLRTDILAALNHKKAPEWKKMPLAFNFQAKLPTEKLIAPYYALPAQVTVGAIAAQGQIQGTLAQPRGVLKWQAPAASVGARQVISGNGEVQAMGQTLLFRNTLRQTGGGTVTLNGMGNLGNKRWQTLLTANSVVLTPFLASFCQTTAIDRAYIPASSKLSSCPATWTSPSLTLKAANARVFGRLDTLDPALLDGDANLLLQVNGGTIALRSRLAKGQIAASALASQVSLAPFLPNLSIPVSLARTQVNLSAAWQQLFENSQFNLNRLQAIADLQLQVAGSTIRAQGQLEGGIFQATATSDRLSLRHLLPQLRVPASLTAARANLSGDLNTFLPSPSSPANWSSLRAAADLQLAVAQGTVRATSQLNGDRWQTKLTAVNLNSASLLSQLTPKSPLNAQLSLSGSLQSLLQADTPLSIQANALAVQLGEQRLTAKGNLLLANLLSTPDIARLQLDVQAAADLSRLPLTEWLSLIPVQRNFLPQALQVTGMGQFQGRLLGKNLLTAPTAPGSLQLTGNLKLANFTLNNRRFDPLLTGTLKAGVGSAIALDLRGRDDIIAAVLDPCPRPECRLPYVPATFDFRYSDGQQAPILAQGKRQGDRVIASVQNFPLSLLNIVPAHQYGIPGSLEGKVTANLDLHLLTGKMRGQLAIDNLGLGSLPKVGLQADFDYGDRLAQLRTAALQFGQSRYALAGSLNFASGAIQGKLDIDRGYVQDVLSALNLSDLSSLVSLLQLKQPDYGAANQVQPQAVGNPDAPLAEQINLLAAIDRQIRALAAKKLAGEIPSELDLRGEFNASVALTGTLGDPQVQFQLQGRDWAWNPQGAFPDIVPPLGLVMTATQVIPIQRVQLQGSLAGNRLTVEPAQIQLSDALVSFNGGLNLATLTWQPSELAIKNLTVDAVSQFARIPSDLSGNLNLQARLSGSLAQPQLQGTFTLADTAINARLLNQTILGKIHSRRDPRQTCTANRLEFQTTAPASIQLYASLPYPALGRTSQPLCDDNPIALNLKLGTESIALLSILTQNQLSWLGGEGEVTLKAQGRLDWDKPAKISDLVAQGQITLKDAVFKSAAFADPLTVNGQIRLNNDRLQVEQLEGTFAQSKLSAGGVLPLFLPLRSSDPAAATPLTIAIDQGKIDLKGLYQGGIDGQVAVRGTALNPIVGGTVRLANGEVFIPEGETERPQTAPLLALFPSPVPPKSRLFVPQLKDFQVLLEGLEISSLPLYRFNFGGALTLNGSLNDLANLQPNGEIHLEQGRVSFLETQFLLNRRHNNAIIFKPTQGLFNPTLDLQMRALVSEFSANRLTQIARQGTFPSNEIPDNSLDRLQRIDIILSVNGQASQLVPTLGKGADRACQIRAQDRPLIPPQGQDQIDSEDLQRLTTCLQVLADRGTSDQQLLSNPVVTLSSVPPRSEGEIVRLLGDQLLAIADLFQIQNEQQLLQFGLAQFAVPLVLQGVVYDVENSISRAIGSTEFRIFPFTEAIYRVEPQGFVRLYYDYSANEVRVQYEKRF